MVGQQHAVRLGEQLRDAGLRVKEHCGGGKLTAGMKRADRSGARFAVIIGEEELADGSVQLKDLRGTGQQQRVGLSNVADVIRRMAA